MKLDIPMIALAGVGVLLLVVAMRGASATGAALVGGAVDLVDGVVGEAGNLAGDVVGIPRTALTRCEADKAAGRTWEASFSCPAGDFLRYLVS